MLYEIINLIKDMVEWLMKLVRFLVEGMLKYWRLFYTLLCKLKSFGNVHIEVETLPNFHRNFSAF